MVQKHIRFIVALCVIFFLQTSCAVVGISPDADPAYDNNFWEATIEVPDICSLFDLHLFIQKIINFDNDHLFEFYPGRNDRNRKIEFSGNSGYPFDGGDYETILLKNIYPLTAMSWGHNEE
jgi:hypothetical protein